MKRGRKPKPPVYRLPSDPKPKAPRCPAWLPAGAKAEWKRLLPQLQEAGHLAELDRTILAAHCVAVADYRRLTMVLEAQDESATISRYNAPWLQRQAAFQQIARTARELGLSPSARKKLPTIPPMAKEPEPGSLLSLLTKSS